MQGFVDRKRLVSFQTSFQKYWTLAGFDPRPSGFLLPKSLRDRSVVRTCTNRSKSAKKYDKIQISHPIRFRR